MANVTLAGGATGSNIVLAGSDALFQINDGEVEFSTDGGTSFIRVPAGKEIAFYDGDTVTPRNVRPLSASFTYTAPY